VTEGCTHQTDDTQNARKMKNRAVIPATKNPQLDLVEEQLPLFCRKGLGKGRKKTHTFFFPVKRSHTVTGISSIQYYAAS
jgi:hypothetical protein